MTQRVLLVLSFDFDGDPDQVAAGVTAAVEAMNPPSLPGFAGEMRVSVEPVSRQVEAWLDDGRPPAPDHPYRYGDPKPRPPGNRAERRAEGRHR